MLQEVEELTPTKKKLRVHVPEDVIRAKLESAYSELRATAKIPGFRPGKVPQSILRKRYGKNVEAEILQKVVPEYYTKAIEEAKLEPVGYPQVEGGIELKADEPLSFTVTVDVKPEIRDLRYEDISVHKKDYTVEDEEMEKAMQSLQESKALFSVTEEAVGEGDLAVINGEAYIDGDLRQELSYKEYPMLQGTDSVPSEFSEEVLGRKKGDEFDVKLTFEADYPNRTVAGKEVIFKIKVVEVKKKNLPPLDDDFAKEFGLDTAEELRNKIRDDIGSKKMSEINLAYKKEILNQLVRDHAFEIPESMLNEEIESFIEQMKESAARRNETIKPEDQLRRDYEANARENVKSVILLDAIGKKENIVVNDDDVRKAIEEIADRHNLKPEEVTKLYSVREGSLDAMKSRLFGDKVLEFLLQKAVIT
jgi:trigger factor